MGVGAVRAGAGGIWRGGLQLAKPVALPDRAARDGRGDYEGVTGTFAVPGEVKDVHRALVLCRYEAVKKCMFSVVHTSEARTGGTGGFTPRIETTG